jgi:uncharacterized OsmC-like protein
MPAMTVRGSLSGGSSTPAEGAQDSRDAAARGTLNGIDLDAVDEIAAAIGADAVQAQIAFRVKTEWKGQARSESTVESYTVAGEVIPRRFSILADQPPELFGTDTAPNPQELLMSAVNACMIMSYVAQAALRGIRLDDCRIETEGELDVRGFLGLDEKVPSGCRRINYTVWLEGEGSRQQHEEIHEAVMAASPNYFNMVQPVQMGGRLA